jgi:DNA primase
LAFPPAFLDDIRARLPLNRLVERKVRLEKRGRDFKGLCPFHTEKTPSFHVFADHYHCYGCGAHGDHFRWVMETDKASFPEAVERLAAEAGLEVPRQNPAAAEAAARIKDSHAVADAVAAEYERRLWLPEGAAALAYLRNRGLSDASIRAFRLGWSGEGFGSLAAALARQDIPAEKLVAAGAMKQREDGKSVDLFFGRVMFPIADARGRVIAFGGRVLGEAVPKYVNSPETALFKKSRTLYGAHAARTALRAGQTLAVVEGYFDVIALAEAGQPAVAPLGTAVTEEHLDALWRLDPCPVLCLDGDAAGAKAAERVMRLALPVLAPGRSLAFASLPQGDDPDTFARRHGAPALAALLARATPLATALYLAIAGQPAATPEARAAQKARLEALAADIGDPTLRREYQRHFRDAWYAARRQPPTATRRPVSRRAPRPPLAADAARHRRERWLLLVLLDHPGVLAQVVEPLGAAQFVHPATEALRAALATHAEDFFGLDSAALLDHVRVLGLSQALEALLGPSISALPRPRLDAAGPGEIAAAWLAEFARLEPERMAHEMTAAQAAFRADPSDANQRRLARLAEARQAAANPPIDPSPADLSPADLSPADLSPANPPADAPAEVPVAPHLE